MNKRPLDVCVISDIHLGTFGCQAHELLNYLKSIEPKTLILNGDIIDIWQFNKRYFPASHMAVIKRIFSPPRSPLRFFELLKNLQNSLFEII